MTPGSAQIEPVHRHRVLGRARHRPQHHELIQRQFGMVPVASGNSELCFNVCRRQELGVQYQLADALKARR